MFGTPLARMMLKQSNLAALLDFPNVIRPNESNPDDETIYFFNTSYRRLFPHVSEWGKVFLGPLASRD